MTDHTFKTPQLMLAAAKARDCLPLARAEGIAFEAVNRIHAAIAQLEMADEIMGGGDE